MAGPGIPLVLTRVRGGAVEGSEGETGAISPGFQQCPRAAPRAEGAGGPGRLGEGCIGPDRPRACDGCGAGGGSGVVHGHRVWGMDILN